MNRWSGIRAFWWRRIRRYRNEICQSCGGPVGRGINFWRTTDELWAAVAGWDGWEQDCGELAYLGPPGTMCPRCFTARAAERGKTVYWQAVSEPSLDDLLAKRGATRMPPEDFHAHFGNLPTDDDE